MVVAVYSSSSHGVIRRVLLLVPDDWGAARGADLCRSEVIRDLEEPPDLGPGRLLAIALTIEVACRSQVAPAGCSGKGKAGEDPNRVRSVLTTEARSILAHEL